MENVMEAVGRVVAFGGGAVAIAYAVFATLGKRWLESKFEERLAIFRHEQAKELERVRHDITRIFSRISKIHEREFEVLPTAMEKLHQSYGAVFRIASSLQQFPEVNSMSAAQFEEFITSSRLPQFRKDEVRQAHDKTVAYRDAIFWVNVADAESAQNDFHNYVVKNRIFMTDDLREKFSAVDAKLQEAITYVSIGKPTNTGQLLREGSGIVWNLGPAVAEVERAVQSRLRYEEA